MTTCLNRIHYLHTWYQPEPECEHDTLPILPSSLLPHTKSSENLTTRLRSRMSCRVFVDWSMRSTSRPECDSDSRCPQGRCVRVCRLFEAFSVNALSVACNIGTFEVGNLQGGVECLAGFDMLERDIINSFYAQPATEICTNAHDSLALRFMMNMRIMEPLSKNY